jgi:hypothetical protein
VHDKFNLRGNRGPGKLTVPKLPRYLDRRR